MLPKPARLVKFFLLIGLLPFSSAHADVPIVVPPPQQVSFVDRATTTAQDAIDQALNLLGIHYRRGGSSPEAGFDCSGFVSHVFREGLGLMLPRSFPRTVWRKSRLIMPAFNMTVISN